MKSAGVARGAILAALSEVGVEEAIRQVNVAEVAGVSVADGSTVSQRTEIDVGEISVGECRRESRPFHFERTMIGRSVVFSCGTGAGFQWVECCFVYLLIGVTGQ